MDSGKFHEQNIDRIACIEQPIGHLRLHCFSGVFCAMILAPGLPCIGLENFENCATERLAFFSVSGRYEDQNHFEKSGEFVTMAVRFAVEECTIKI
jgi:hypothetical protein